MSVDKGVVLCGGKGYQLKLSLAAEACFDLPGDACSIACSRLSKVGFQAQLCAVRCWYPFALLTWRVSCRVSNRADICVKTSVDDAGRI